MSELFGDIYGADPEIEQARNKLPEPVRTDARIYHCLKPIPPIAYSISTDSLFTDRPTITEIPHFTFERAKVWDRGTWFEAWKCLDDGKFYL